MAGEVHGEGQAQLGLAPAPQGPSLHTGYRSSSRTDTHENGMAVCVQHNRFSGKKVAGFYLHISFQDKAPFTAGAGEWEVRSVRGMTQNRNSHLLNREKAL